MHILLIGLNHKTAPLELREKLCLSSGNDTEPLETIMKIPQVSEALYLATCNRVEVLAVLHKGEEEATGLKDLLLGHGNLSSAELESCIYVQRDLAAVGHLFRVASSLDSMIMGETQILGQVKEAYRRAAESNATGLILNKLLHHAFRVAKRVRTETGVAQNAVSVSYAAVTLAKKIFGTLKGKKILLVGAGEMAELAARQLAKYGADEIIIANRTFSRALELGAEIHGEAIEWTQLTPALAEADIVITSTGAADYVLSADMVARAVRERRNRLLFLIDIAVPRDIDPRAGKLENVFLYNIDNLQDIVDDNFQRRKEEAQKAELIIAEEIGRYLAWQGSLEAVPTINLLRARFAGTMNGELQRNAHWLNSIGEKNQQQVEIMMQSLINKLLHDPVTILKEESRDNGAATYILALRRMFRLDDS